MVALFVLTTGFLGIVTLLSQSLYISKNISTETTATYLAAEGIELAKNIIDHDVYQHLDCNVQGTGWAQGSHDTAFTVGRSYQLDYTTCNDLAGRATDCDPQLYNNQNQLLLDPTTGLYGYQSGAPTPFTREVRISSDLSNEELTVQSIVTWHVGLGTQSVTLEDDFYNWHPSTSCT